MAEQIIDDRRLDARIKQPDFTVRRDGLKAAINLIGFGYSGLDEVGTWSEGEEGGTFTERELFVKVLRDAADRLEAGR